MKKIYFIPSSKDTYDLVDYPKPSSLSVPKWYKNKSVFKNNEKPKIIGNLLTNASVKSCWPFKDALNMGYIQKTWCDIYVEVDDKKGKIRIHSFSGVPKIVEIRPERSIEVGDGFYPLEFTWTVPWIPKSNKGYSTLFTHPLNRPDLPFFTTSGVVDSDTFYHQPFGSYPFYLKEGFSGLIPEGTPMFQIIPIKRDSWSSKALKFDETKTKKNLAKIRKRYIGAYKRFFRKEKKYY